MRGSTAGSLSALNRFGLAAEVGASVRRSPLTRFRLDVGGQAYASSEQQQSCPEEVPVCQSNRSLTSATHVTIGVERRLTTSLPTLALIGGIGQYWSSTNSGGSVDPARHVQSLGVNVGALVSFGEMETELRAHVPVGAMGEVHWLLIGLVKVTVGKH